MYLRTETDYALRVLLFLAHRNDQATAEQIASSYQISKEHIVKVIQHLGRFGYVRSQSGRNGGVRLAKLPADINVGVIVEQFEGRNGVLACVTDPGYCVMEPGCVLRLRLIEAESAFYDHLKNVTIADLIKPTTGGINNVSISIRGRPAPVPPGI